MKIQPKNLRSGCLDNNGVNNMKKVIIPALLILSACILSACSKNENTEKYIYETTAYQYINDPNHKELQTKFEDKEQIEIAKKIIKDSEKAFKISLQEASDRDLGACSAYCPDKTVLDNASTTNVSIEYLNTKQDGDSGYIWVKYTAEYLDGYGEGFKGSYDVVSRWEIKKENNEWKVTKITEAI